MKPEAAIPRLNALTEESEDGEIVAIATYPSARDADQHGLVILALGEAYWLIPAIEGHRLFVRPGIAERAKAELDRFAVESVGWPPVPDTDPADQRPPVLVSPLLWSLVLVACYWGQALHPDWTVRGALDATGLWQRHEWASLPYS